MSTPSIPESLQQREGVYFIKDVSDVEERKIVGTNKIFVSVK